MKQRVSLFYALPPPPPTRVALFLFDINDFSPFDFYHAARHANYAISLNVVPRIKPPTLVPRNFIVEIIVLYNVQVFFFIFTSKTIDSIAQKKKMISLELVFPFI